MAKRRESTRTKGTSYPYDVVSITDGKEAAERVETVTKGNQTITTRTKCKRDETRCECDSLDSVTAEAGFRLGSGEWQQDEVVALPHGVKITREALAAAVRPSEPVDIWIERGRKPEVTHHFNCLDNALADLADDEIPAFALRAYLPFDKRFALPINSL